MTGLPKILPPRLVLLDPSDEDEDEDNDKDEDYVVGQSSTEEEEEEEEDLEAELRGETVSSYKKSNQTSTVNGPAPGKRDSGHLDDIDSSPVLVKKIKIIPPMAPSGKQGL